MSEASERKAARDTLVQYPLMTLGHLAEFLGCSKDHARGLVEDGAIPAVDIGRKMRHEWRVDPMDAAVFLLAGREQLSAASFWEEHGPEGTPERCRRLVQRIRKIQDEGRAA